ncbi:MAG: PD-(D/E)XK nuclease family protein, partial [Deltaproteobacteria bacterium]|nr:PD-(D/E)XK nuclease family protein [Deltaproteobacteria bacterium]
EYQDTNDLQALFVKLLFRPEDNRLFLVGDPRQSIYRFRGANVAGFFSMAEHIRQSGGVMLPLHENFRSRPGIISFVNRVAATLFTPPLELVATLEPTATPEVIALCPPTTKDHSADEIRAHEARSIAATIHTLVTNEGFSLGDIVCLFQALTSTDIYEQALRLGGIPSRIFGGGYLLERPEIADLLSALSFAAFPERNRALIALLRSPLVGLSDDDLVLLAGEDGKGLRRNIRHHAEAGPILTLLETSHRLRRPSEIIRALLDHTGYEIFSATVDPSGGRTANIDRFLTIIENLEASAPISLRALVRYLHDLKIHGARLGETPATAEPTNAVRMMTVHAAKGLEFPVVILPDLIRGSHRANTQWCFARGEGLGLPPDVETLATREREADEEERKRLLYVALTRAEERLILPLHPDTKAKGLWHQWLLPFLNAPEVTVRDPESGIRSPEKDFRIPDPGSLIPKIEVFSPPPKLTLDTDAVRTFTVSELETFARCPQEYYLKHVVGVPAESLLPQHREALPAYLRGSILHSVLEELEPEHLELLPDLIERHCLANHVVPDERLIAELRGPLDLFCTTPLFQSLGKGRREVPFRWQWEKIDVVGKIDWLRPEREGGWEIIDFKTDRLEPSEVGDRAKTYDLQMTTYALAVEAALEEKVTSTTLHFLQPGVPFTVPMDDRRRNEGKRAISAIAKRIAEANFTLGTFTPPCARPDTTCPYHLNGLCWLDFQKRSPGSGVRDPD